jgi:hypothetical protein
MKNFIVYLLIISFLLESCYSYKTIDLNNTKLIVGHKYKIAEDNKLIKVRLKSFDDSTATMMVRKIEKQIEFSKIKTIKTRKFSIIKTIIVIPVILIPMVLIGSGFKTGGYYSDQGNFNPP